MSKIYVGNCSFDVTEQQLRDVFATYGDVASVSVITDRDTGRPRGFAFIEMSDQGGGVGRYPGPSAIRTTPSSAIGAQRERSAAPARRAPRSRSDRFRGTSVRE